MQQTKRNIIFVGPMGAGKTTIGRKIAKKLEREFYDSDHEIEKRTGADIPLIFEIEQESGFRKREQAIIEELTQHQAVVLSTGGGAVLNEQNKRNIKRNSIVFYLKSSPSKLLKRTKEDKRRPLLQTENRFERIKSILEEREPLYLEVADEIIETDKLSIGQIVNKIMTIINKYENHNR